jgi:GNAT superfamily N-acetyltransferase
MKINEISAAQTWPLRHEVMWPEKPLDFVKLEADEQGYHFGLFLKEELVSIVSVFISDDNSAQFRKLATLEKHQGNGYASKLLSHIIAFTKNQGVKTMWCNSRFDKLSFYKKFGMLKTEHTFIKETIKFVILKKQL